MDLAPPLLAGVRDAGSAQLSDSHFTALLSHADDLIRASLQPAQPQQSSKPGTDLRQPPAGVAGAVYKSGLSGVSALLLQAASQDSASGDITSVLEDAQWPAPRISQLVALYDAVRPHYRTSLLPALSSLSAAVPHLTQPAYQLDYYLRSNLAEHIRQPVLFVHLGVATGVGRDGVLSFSATAEELHDMLAKVKEAVRAAQHRHEES